MQITVNIVNKPSRWAHAHATFHFGRKTGKIWVLTRDANKSVSDHYRCIGQAARDANGTEVVAIYANDTNARICATLLERMGRTVLGAETLPFAVLETYSPQRDGYDIGLTDPETIKFHLGRKCDRRRKSLDLGIAGKADKVARSLSVEDMRAAILARK